MRLLSTIYEDDEGDLVETRIGGFRSPRTSGKVN